MHVSQAQTQDTRRTQDTPRRQRRQHPTHPHALSPPCRTRHLRRRRRRRRHNHRQLGRRRRRLRLHLARPHNHHRPIARHPIHHHKQQRRPGREQVRVRGHLRDVQHVRPVAVDRVRAVELQMPLAHVHRVRREPAPGEHDRRVGRRVVGRRPRVRRRRHRHVKVGSAVAQRRRHTRHLRTHPGRKVVRVEYLGRVRRRVRRVELDINVGIRTRDQDGCVREKDGGRVVHAGNAARAQPCVGPPGTLGRVGVVDGRCADGAGRERLEKGHLVERRRVEGLVGETSSPVGRAVDDEQGTVGKRDELTHRATYEHVVVLFVLGGRAVLGFGRQTLAVRRCGIGPGVVKRPRVVSIVVVRHVGTATEEERRSVVVGRGEREHRDGARGRVHTGHAVGHVGQRCLDVFIGVPEN